MSLVYYVNHYKILLYKSLFNIRAKSLVYYTCIKRILKFEEKVGMAVKKSYQTRVVVMVN